MASRKRHYFPFRCDIEQIFCGNTALASGVLVVTRMLRNYLREEKILCMERLKEHNLLYFLKRLEGVYSDL